MADQPINRYRVRVIYRSGATIDLETSGFEWKGSVTGALREVVRTQLRGHPAIERSELAPREQGGDGATVAYLRQG